MVTLAISGAAEERKSHAPISAVINSIDPNEATKALKKFTVLPLHSSVTGSSGGSQRVMYSPALELGGSATATVER